jgi:hypothetical protein
MRKGLVTLGVVALVLAVSPVFAEAPILSCLPDLVVSDYEPGGMTADSNMFVFSDAVSLDELVEDGDTNDDQLRWSGIDPSGSIAINDILLNDPLVDTLNPGAQDLRAADAMMTVRNVAWDAAPPGAGSTTETIIELYVSDATTVTQGSMKVTTVDTDGSTGSQEDAVLPPTVASWTFDAGADGWGWFEIASLIIPTHTATGGALTITEAAGSTDIVYGAYESPQDPTIAVMPKLGCIYRARYQIASSGHPTMAQCPGFRLRGATVEVFNPGTGWVAFFGSFNTNSLDQVQFSTVDFIFNLGTGDEYNARIPDAGQEYTLMLFPRQVQDSLVSDDVNQPIVHYFSVDLLDLEGGVDNDQGTLSVDSVSVDAIDRPEIGTGTAVPGLTFDTADFATGWTASVVVLPPGPMNAPGTTAQANASGLTITVGAGNSFFEAYAELDGDGVALDEGMTYRVAFWCTSDDTAGGNVGPLVRTNLDSSRFVWNALKELKGGALLATLDSTPSLMELWAVAPPAQTSTPGQTEGMKPKFSSYQVANDAAGANFPHMALVGGTVGCTRIETESFDW